MKKYLMFFFMSVLCFAANAQTFYEVQYYDVYEKENYLGLMTYWNNDRCTMRCIPMSGEDVYWECSYSASFDKEDGVNYMIFSPVPEKGKENLAYPYFAWTWTKSNASDQSETPLVFFDAEDEDEEMVEAKYFEEIDLADMDEEYIGQFYDKSERMYTVITQACNLVNNQRPEPQRPSNNDNNNVNPTPTPTPTPTPSPSQPVNNSTAVTMHFVMVAATKDESIGESVQTDLQLAQPKFREYANNLGIEYKEHIISGNSFNKNNIMNTLNGINAAKNDIIVFLYSGHGFRFDDDTDAYPRMYLAYDEDVNANNYLGVTDVYNLLVKKNARLTIVLTDCCNSNYGATRQEVEGSGLHSRGHNNYDVKKLEKLFITSSGSVKATAAKAGQYALCDAQGGFLLTSFLNNINSAISAVSSEVPSWQTILDNASNYVKNKTANDYGEDGNSGPQVVVKSVNIK